MRKANSYVIKIALVAVLAALGFLLDRFLTVSTPAVKINLAFVPAAFAAVLSGPVCGALVYGLTDLVGALLLPFGPYHPGFTVCAALMGALYGLFLYRKNSNVRFFPNILPPVIINCLVIGLLINTAWVSMLYGSKTYLGWFSVRLIEYAILVPVQLVVLPLLVKLSARIKKQFPFI